MHNGQGVTAVAVSVVGALTLLAACATPTVETERADAVPVGAEPASSPSVESDPAVATTSSATTSTTPASSTTPTDDAASPTTTATATPPTITARPPALGVGDELFEDLGSSDVDVESYDVRLTIDPTLDVVQGHVDLRAGLAPGLRVFPLDQVGLEIGAVSVDGEDTTFETTATELLIDLPDGRVSGPAAEFDIGVDYTFDPGGAVSSVGLPSGWFEDETTGDSYVLNEPDGARTWLPSNDHPSDKALWTFDVVVPDGLVAVANGDLTARPVGPSGSWRWSQDEPMSTYLVQLVVGDYEIVVPDAITRADGTEIPLLHVVPAGERVEFEGAFDTVAEQTAFFEELFGPYPLERYGLAFVRGLSDLAMETQGRSMFGADDFPGGTVGFTQQLLLAHELAHQWFGNAVSPADWSDIWLNESITTYAQWLWLDHVGLQPLESYADQMLAERQTDGESTGEPSLDEMFGFLRYDGGAPVVHALRRVMGGEAFFDLLTAWVTDHSGTSQSTETFIALAERFHGSDLTDFFETWLFSGDLPESYP